MTATFLCKFCKTKKYLSKLDMNLLFKKIFDRRFSPFREEKSIFDKRDTCNICAEFLSVALHFQIDNSLKVAKSLLARYDTSVLAKYCEVLRNSFRCAWNIKYRKRPAYTGYAMHQSVPYIFEMIEQKLLLQELSIERVRLCHLNFKTWSTWV